MLVIVVSCSETSNSSQSSAPAGSPAPAPTGTDVAASVPAIEFELDGGVCVLVDDINITAFDNCAAVDSTGAPVNDSFQLRIESPPSDPALGAIGLTGEGPFVLVVAGSEVGSSRLTSEGVEIRRESAVIKGVTIAVWVVPAPTEVPFLLDVGELSVDVEVNQAPSGFSSSLAPIGDSAVVGARS
jgi:hypothetical protein